MTKPRIVEAVGIASGSGLSGKKSNRARKIEQAIATEIQKCFDEGLANDQDQIRERMAQVRKKTAERLDKEEALEAARQAAETAKEAAAASASTYKKLLGDAE